jgi:uncharacterized membrane-anchored protein
MKLAKTSLSGTSIALLVIQLLLVTSIAAKYLYQRSTCPKVWVRTAAYDPEMVMRGRYLSLRLAVDGCQSTLPSAPNTDIPRNSNGGVKVNWRGDVQFRAKLKVEGNKLIAIRIPDADESSKGVNVSTVPNSACDAMRLDEPVNFFISEHANDPSRLKAGEELWIEVTVPPIGPPRPIQLALKQNGAWKPLAFQ